MSEIKADTRLRRADLPGSRIEDEIVFFNPTAGRYYSTGTVGAEIWDILASPQTFEAICARLLEVYTIDRATCEQQARAFLSEMHAANLIEIVIPTQKGQSGG